MRSIKIILDYIDFGNCLRQQLMWLDERVEQPDKTQAGFVGPVVSVLVHWISFSTLLLKNFQHSPKIVRSLISMGELRSLLDKMSNDQNRTEYEALYAYLKILDSTPELPRGLDPKEITFTDDGFTSFRAYLLSEMVEVLTFYGDWYDTDNILSKRIA